MGAASLFKERRSRKKDKVESKRAAAALRHSLAVALPEVQREYDYDFSHLDQRFATGNGKRFRSGVKEATAQPC